ncbi:MAG: class I SAM-dependent methyltransferase [Acidobacteria bacterium]|nr:class I SAM-dependent methyltransferase [Acidobacteriota bacterium]MBI3658444.1 class I SAM-dependent methyltransferase [Acidobacteriota bacterium]
MQREGYQVTAEFETNYWWFLSRRELFLTQVRKAAEDLSSVGRPLMLLDFGCGTGFNLNFLANFGIVYGADVAKESLTEFQKTNFPLINLKFDDGAYHGRFNILTALDVLEHTDDDVAALQQMKQFLAPQAQIVLTVPAYRWLWSGEDIISHHKRRYTRTDLIQCAHQAGCEVLYCSYFNFSVLPMIASVIWFKKLCSPHQAEHSDLRPLPHWLNSFLYKLTSCEARWVGEQRQRMPAGASLICRLKPL